MEPAGYDKDQLITLARSKDYGKIEEFLLGHEGGGSAGELTKLRELLLATCFGQLKQGLLPFLLNPDHSAPYSLVNTVVLRLGDVGYPLARCDVEDGMGLLPLFVVAMNRSSSVEVVRLIANKYPAAFEVTLKSPIDLTLMQVATKLGGQTVADAFILVRAELVAAGLLRAE